MKQIHLSNAKPSVKSISFRAKACAMASGLLLLSACGGGYADRSTTNPAFSPVIGAAETNSLMGTVAGLAAGSQLVLVNNGDSTMPVKVSADGSFTFAKRYAVGATYNVTVSAQPDTQNCRVVNGAGKFPMSTSLSVRCVGSGKLAAGSPFATTSSANLPASLKVSTISNKLPR